MVAIACVLQLAPLPQLVASPKLDNCPTSIRTLGIRMPISDCQLALQAVSEFI